MMPSAKAYTVLGNALAACHEAELSALAKSHTWATMQAMSSTSEADLIARCQQGEATAWDALFDQHYAPVGRFVFQLASDFTWEDSEEICQETFLAAIKAIGGFHGECQLQTWLFRIAANKARDYRERQRAAKRGGGQPSVSLQAENEETGLTLDPASHLPSPDEILASAERAAQVAAAVERLGGPCREIIELRYFGDLSYEEIAKSLELNEKTVSSRLSKCRDKLAAVLQGIFSGEQRPLSPSNP
jgi:RNA polymerase sigma-70 factor (ECF subfamily)